MSNLEQLGREVFNERADKIIARFPECNDRGVIEEAGRNAQQCLVDMHGFSWAEAEGDTSQENLDYFAMSMEVFSEDHKNSPIVEPQDMNECSSFDFR